MVVADVKLVVGVREDRRDWRVDWLAVAEVKELSVLGSWASGSMVVRRVSHVSCSASEDEVLMLRRRSPRPPYLDRLVSGRGERRLTRRRDG